MRRERDPKRVVFVALDVSSRDEALKLADELDGVVGGVKVGSQLFTGAGPEIVTELAERHRVFLDLKWHDIPNTVAGAAFEGAKLGATIMNVHCAPGTTMMAAALKGAEWAVKEGFRPEPPMVIGVTVLTSHIYEELLEEGLVKTPGEVYDHHNLSPDSEAFQSFKTNQVRELVLRRAERARKAGLDGVVASPQEIAALRERFGEGFLLVIPGIRPAGAKADDQARIATPKAAMAAGADYLVVGRPIIEAPDPAEAARRIADDAFSGMVERERGK